ncbi:DUF1932 domain-containing protein [Solicola sp. PLA-1-18]|uniref:NAD(P)-dependent oxidoreductase n=1 Tax=Solicola sp. PLA-1-18 TaxID=3380532 RepID=UPI003B774118
MTQNPAPSTTRAVAIIGHGEVGRAYSGALAERGHEVRAYDPFLHDEVAGVRVCGTTAEAIDGADAIFVLTAAGASRAVAEEVAPQLTDQRLYADFTSSAPSDKQALAPLFDQSRAELADVAILGPVIKLGARTPLMTAGPGAEEVAHLMRPLGADVDVVDGPVGAAMGHKLLRSVFMKGLASTIIEAVEAGRAAGFEPWIRDQIARELAGDGTATIERFETGSRLHGRRRADEMDAAAGYLASLEVPGIMSAAAAEHLRHLTRSS